MENLKRIEKLKNFTAVYAQNDNFELLPLATDASSRKYYRAVFSNRPNIVVMDDEGCRCKTREFVELSKFLRPKGVYVPKVLKQDMENGILLLEDLGNDTISKLLTDNNEEKLYAMCLTLNNKQNNIK